MRILCVAATAMEVAPLVAKLRNESGAAPRLYKYTHAGHHLDLLLTGVGMVATAAWCSQVLARTPYDLGLNFGVCGSFDWSLGPGVVVHVTSDCFAELLGAEDGDGFLTIEELNLLGENEPPFTAGRLVNAAPPAASALAGLPAVRGITVNTVHGNPRMIDAVARRFEPQVESMEGAAFMYACMIYGTPFAQVRAVSNFVERRQRGAWKMTEAISALGAAALSVIETV